MNKQTIKKHTHTQTLSNHQIYYKYSKYRKRYCGIFVNENKKNQPEPFKGIPDAFGFSYKPKKICVYIVGYIYAMKKKFAAV